MNCIWGRRTIWKRAIDNSIGLLNMVWVWMGEDFHGWCHLKGKASKEPRVNFPETRTILAGNQYFPRNQDHSCWFAPFGANDVWQPSHLKQVIFGLPGKERWCGHHPQQLIPVEKSCASCLPGSTPARIFQVFKYGLDTCVPNGDISFSKLSIYLFIKWSWGKREELIKHFIIWLI